MTDTDTFTGIVTGESFKINHQLSCDDNARNNILEKLQMILLDIDGTITIPTLENLIGKSLACKNIIIDTLVVHITWGS